MAYLADFVTGGGAGAGLGQHEAASNEAAAARMASLAIFMMVGQIGVLSLCSRTTSSGFSCSKLADLAGLASANSNFV